MNKGKASRGGQNARSNIQRDEGRTKLIAGADIGSIGGAASIESAAAVPRTIVASVKAGDEPALLAHFACNLELWWGKALPFSERFGAAARLGFTKVEFWSATGTDRSARSIADQCRDNGLATTQMLAEVERIADPAYSLGRYLDDIRRAIEQAHVVGAPKLLVVGHEVIAGLSHSEMLTRYAARLGEAAPLAAEAGIVIMIEGYTRHGHEGYFLYGSPDLLAIARGIGRPEIKCVWHFYHMQRAEGNLVDNFRRAVDQVTYVQIADSPGRNQPGTGEINHDFLLRAVRQAGYGGPIGLSLVPLPGTEARVATEMAALARRVAL